VVARGSLARVFRHSGLRSQVQKKEVAMKAAAHQSRCSAGSLHSTHAGIRPRLSTSHRPKRQIAALPAVAGRAADPRLTAPAAGAPAQQAGVKGPVVLHVDSDLTAAVALASLLMPEARVTHVTSLADAARLLGRDIFSLVVIDPSLPDGDGVALLPQLATTPVLVYATRDPRWPAGSAAFLPKPWTTHRQLWTALSRMLGIGSCVCAGD
jgi:CheY-like chemotaxis protein